MASYSVCAPILIRRLPGGVRDSAKEHGVYHMLVAMGYGYYVAFFGLIVTAIVIHHFVKD